MNNNDKRRTPSATVKFEQLNNYTPITDNQAKAFDSWNRGKHLVLSGSAGTGKTFLGLYFGLTEVLKKNSDYEQLIIVRSIVPTRAMGFLPGDEREKEKSYQDPYHGLVNEMTGDGSGWLKLVNQKKVLFKSTSFIRGITFDNSIILVDEMQNLTFHELDSVITRVGINSRIIFAGDYYQSDFHKSTDKAGITKFLEIIEYMKDFNIITFNWEDIVRSDFVRDYIMTKEMLEKKKVNREWTN